MKRCRLRWLSWSLAVCSCLSLPSGTSGADEPYDLLIRGGKIVDGTGNPWYYGDVAIRGDRLVAVGRVPEAEARREIDARGLIVAPGFIDMHSHSDYLLLEDGHAQSKVRQGVTTDVLGEGSSGGPYQGKLDPKKVDVGEVTVSWRTLGEYLDTLDRQGIAINVATYVGEGNVWRCVMGDSFDRPTADQIGQMQKLVAAAMQEGAFGLSSMMASPPGLLATTDDLVALAEVAGQYGGIYSSHIRNEGTDVFTAVKEAIEVGRRAGVPVDVIHIKIADQRLWGRMNEIVDLINDARREGVNVQANVYPYTRGNNNLRTILPPWAHEGGTDAMLARLKDSADRERMKKDILAGLPGWYNHYLAVGGDWGRMLVNADLSSANKRFEGWTMDRVLADRGQTEHPLDGLFDFLTEEEASISTIYAHHSEDDMNLAMRQPWCSIGSDGSAYSIEGPLRRGKPHPRNFGTFPRVLGVYVRERGLLALEDAVRKMTSLNAAKIGLKHRGELREGYFADVTLFDPDRVIDRATYLDPFQSNEGIEHVVVNGRVVLDRGRHTNARPGRTLRKGPE